MGRLQARAIAHASLHHSRGEDGARIPIVGLSADHLPVPAGKLCEVGTIHDQGLADAREATVAVVGYEDHDCFSLYLMRLLDHRGLTITALRRTTGTRHR